MRVIKREIFGLSRTDTLRIIPLGDIHIGSAACDEKLLRATVERIKCEPLTFWIGQGDYADWINRNDRRFNPGSLAKWIKMADLVDLGKAQEDRLIEVLGPIAHKCLALVKGNHEDTIEKYTERAIYKSLASRLKEAGGLDPEIPLCVGTYGWLRLALYRSEKRQCAVVKNINLHHGFTGGRLAGAKALNMQRWLWTHNADLVLFGHSHNTGIQIEAVETITRAGRVKEQQRIGAYTGTFLRSTKEGASTYSEKKGYLPLPIGGVEIEILMNDGRMRVSCAV